MERQEQHNLHVIDAAEGAKIKYIYTHLADAIRSGEIPIKFEKWPKESAGSSRGG